MDVTESQAIVVSQIVIDANEFFAPCGWSRHNRANRRKTASGRIGLWYEGQERRSCCGGRDMEVRHLRSRRTICRITGTESSEIAATLGIRWNVLWGNRRRIFLSPPFL